MTDQVGDDTAEDIQQELEQADADVTDRQRWWAFAQLAALFGGILLSLAALVLLGIVDLSITATFDVSAGWILEYLLLGLVVAFLLYVAMLLLIAAPGSILSLAGAVAYGIAESQGLIDEDTQ